MARYSPWHSGEPMVQYWVTHLVLDFLVDLAAAMQKARYLVVLMEFGMGFLKIQYLVA